MRQREFSPLIAKAVMLVFMLEYLLYNLWVNHTDIALKIEYYHTGGINFPNPYGWLWTILNPFYWDDFIYKMFLSGVVIGFAVLQWWLYTKGKISFWLIIAVNLQNMIWVWVTGYQHIIGTEFQALSFVNPLFMIVWVLIQFPIGNPSGWACDFGPDKLFYQYLGRYYQLCGPGLQWGSMGLIIWHVMELLWFIVPMTYWGIKILRYFWKKFR